MAGLTVGVSAIVHVGLAAAVLTQWGPFVLGGGGHVLDAIEIELAEVRPMESAARDADAGIGSTSAAAENDGKAPTATVANAPSAEVSEQSKPPSKTQQPEDADDSEIAVPPKAEPKPGEPRPETAEVKPLQQPAPAAAAASPSAVAGGSVAVATVDATATAQPAAAASPGEIARFRSDVSKALAQHPPRQKSSDPPITAVIAFSITENGRTERVELLESSASARMNQLLLAWISGTPMPIPPKGLPLAQRYYCIPIGSSAGVLRRHTSCR